jgi:alcohol dehydrogenase (cytochrome c)
MPHDVHDADLSQVSPLFETTVGGKKRKVISVSGKDGLLRLLDRETHEQLYEVPITNRHDWKNGKPEIRAAGIRPHICSGRH